MGVPSVGGAYMLVLEAMGAKAYVAAGMVTGVMHGVGCLPATSGGSRQQHGEGGVSRLG